MIGVAVVVLPSHRHGSSAPRLLGQIRVVNWLACLGRLIDRFENLGDHRRLLRQYYWIRVIGNGEQTPTSGVLTGP